MANRDSDMSGMAATSNYIPTDEIDCGIRRLGWCRGPTCQKYARLRTFIIVLSFAGLLQGASEAYFRITAKQAAVQNYYNPIIIEWLLVSSGIFQALFAIPFAYWAHKIHNISWLAGTIVLQSLVCVIAMIPTIMNFSNGVRGSQTPVPSQLCLNSTFAESENLLTEDQNNLITLVLLFVLQLVIGLGALAYYTIGVVYIDDNSASVDSAAVIGAALAARVIGTQLGSSLTMGVEAISLGWWLGWLMLAAAIFVSGVLLGLFPKRLPKTVIHQAAQRIIEDSRRLGNQMATYIDDPALGASMKRLFTNKLLQCNLLGIMFIQAATLNFLAQEETYLQSRFYLPFSEEDGLQQEWQLRFVAYFMRPPVAALGLIIGGLIISKMKLSGRKITIISIVTGLHLVGFYVAFIFIKCDVGNIEGVLGYRLQKPLCAIDCVCETNSFSPVCLEGTSKTYFSPCFAGCTAKTSINKVELYENCACGVAPYNRATEGSCNASSCAAMLILFQVMTLSAAGILGVMMIGKLIITLRSVLPQDKGLAVAMEVMYVGFFAYIPAHFAYDAVSRTTCLYYDQTYSRCVLRETPKHGNILNILSASLVLVGVFFDVLVFIFAKDLNIYNCKVTDANYTPSLYSPVPRDEPDAMTALTAMTPVAHTPITPSAAQTPGQEERRTIPHNEITVFRNPSSVTSDSTTNSSVIEPGGESGVTYAQVVFPPDKHKPNDGSTSPKRLAVRADVPPLHLSKEDVRAQLGTLKSFNPQGSQPNRSQKDTNVDEIRPLSPETDF